MPSLAHMLHVADTWRQLWHFKFYSFDTVFCISATLSHLHYVLADFQSKSFNVQPSLTHQPPVVWKLAQPQTASPRYICGQHTIYLYFTSNANRWALGRMFSSIKYKHFVQVSSKQKNIFTMFADVRCGQESISKQPWYILPAGMVVLPTVTHMFHRVRK